MISQTIRRILLLAAGLVVTASVASAQDGVPDADHSFYDHIGVGSSSGSGFQNVFHVTVNDWNGVPVAGANVALWFGTTGVRGYSTQNSGTTFNVDHRTISRIATTGSATFVARTGGFDNVGGVTIVASKTVDGLLNDVTIASDVKWRSTDIDALGGSTGLGDLAHFGDRFIRQLPAPECNFDLKPAPTGDPDVPGLGDFAIFAAEYLIGAHYDYAW